MVVALDPGKNIGLAYVRDDGRLEHAEIITLVQLTELAFPPDATVVLGNSTGSKALQRVLKEKSVSYVLVDETDSSLEGRELYFKDYPPEGLMRLLPRGLWSPPRPIDDYAAYAIALRYLRGQKEEAGTRPAS